MLSVRDQLVEYLAYFGELGITHVRATLPTIEPVKVAPAPTPALRATPAVERAMTQAPKKANSGSMSTVLNMVQQASPAPPTGERAAAIEGDDPSAVLRELYQAFETCKACALGTTRKRFVFGEGPPNASLMFVGEGPGRREDETGRPFVGDAGNLLTRIIEAMGLKRNDVFIANVVKCRPPDNRTPLPDEMATCSPILMKQIDTIRPKLLVALGGTALRFFKGGPSSIVRSRGVFFEWRGYRVMPTFHPAYILRNPACKRDVWDDMKKVMAALGLDP